jgi:hypothetical protein
MQDASAEAGEQGASCAVDGSDVDSIWYAVDVPAGKLIIDTSTSPTGFDVVVAVYERAATLATLTEVACAVSPDGEPTLKKNLSAGRYYVRFATDDGLIIPGRMLGFLMSLKPAAGFAAPSNDEAASAKKVTFNKTSAVNNVQYATSNMADPDSACETNPVGHTVWFTFDINLVTSVIISAEGSLYDHAGVIYSSGPNIALYSGSPGALTPVNCDESSGILGAGRLELTLVPNTYYVMVYTNLGYGLSGRSTARLRVVPGAYGMMRNADFEDGLSGWSLKKASGEGLTTGDEAIVGTASFKFTGGPGENSQLWQTKVIPKTMYVIEDSLISLKYRTDGIDTPPPAGSIMIDLVLTYKNGSTTRYKTPLKFLANGSPLLAEDVFVVPRKGLSKVQLTFRNRATSGALALDSMVFFVFTTTPSLRGTAAAGPLPLPPSP